MITSIFPIDRPCVFCGASPGVPCKRPHGSRDGFHAARLNPAVRGSSFSGSKNLVESRERGSRRGAAKKRARARSKPEKGRVFSVWYYVKSDRLLWTNECAVELDKIDAKTAREWGAVLVSGSGVSRARRLMKRRNDGPVVVVRVTVRVRR